MMNPDPGASALKFLSAVITIATLTLAAPPCLQADVPLDHPPADGVTTVGLKHEATSDQTWVQPDNTRDTGLTSEPLSHLNPQVNVQPFPFDPKTMMHVSEVQPGMKGYGLSVFSGLKPVKFDVEVVGVRHRMLAGTDIVMCQLTSPYLKDIGVIAGMSGSPVFLNDRLLGAVAYGFTDVKDALGGITPIETMLQVYNSTPVTPAPPDAGGDSQTFDKYNRYMALRTQLHKENITTLLAGFANTNQQSPTNITLHASDFPHAAEQGLHLPDQFQLRPLTSPVVLYGAPSGTASLLQSLFPDLGIMSAATPLDAFSTYVPSAQATNSPGGPVTDINDFANEITGGYAMAIPYVEGDLSMAAVGTVTWRNGNRLVAFGHPMSEKGNVALPMSAARINAIIRSADRPFKLGEPVGQIGMIREDRLPAVGGLFGQKAPMCAVNVQIGDPDYLGQKQFKYRMLRDRDLTPGLLASILMESISSGGRSGGNSASLLSYTVAMSDGTSFTKEDYSVDSDGPTMAAIGSAMDIAALMTNPFKKVQPDSVEFSMRVTDKLPQASLQTAELDEAVYRPGDSVNVSWDLQPYQKDLERNHFTFTVPPSLLDGDYVLTVCDARHRDALEDARNPSRNSIFDYASLVREIRRNYPSNRVYLVLEDEDTGVAVRGNEMPKLPGSIINTIQGTVNGRYFAPLRGNILVDADTITHYQVSGQVKLKLKVRRSQKDDD